MERAAGTWSSIIRIFIGIHFFSALLCLGEIRVRVCVSPPLVSSTHFGSSRLTGQSLGI